MANYLYNGTKLPEAPEHDETIYPHLAIANNTSMNMYILVLMTKPGYVGTDGYIKCSEAATVVTYVCSKGDATWTEYQTDEYEADHGVANTSTMVPIWSNTDVLNEDGTLYLAATEPIAAMIINNDFWNGVACGLGSSAIANFTDTTPFGKGYIIGTYLKAVRPRVVNVLDNEWPIEFSVFAVANNSTKMDLDGIPLIKVSDLAPTFAEISAIASIKLVASLDGMTQELILSKYMASPVVDGVTAAVFLQMQMNIGAYLVSVSQENVGVDINGITFPEAGLYVSDFTVMYPDIAEEVSDVVVTISQGSGGDGEVLTSFPVEFILPGGLANYSKATIIDSTDSDLNASMLLSCCRIFDTPLSEDILQRIQITMSTTITTASGVSDTQIEGPELLQYAGSSDCVVAGASSEVMAFIFSVSASCSFSGDDFGMSGMTINFDSPGTYFMVFSDMYIALLQSIAGSGGSVAVNYLFELTE